MNPELLKYCNHELQYIREMSGEFAKGYPKIAGRRRLDAYGWIVRYEETNQNELANF